MPQPAGIGMLKNINNCKMIVFNRRISFIFAIKMCQKHIMVHIMEDRLSDKMEQSIGTQQFVTGLRSQSDSQSAEKSLWWAMSAPYRRELKAKAILDSCGIECFVPMRNQPVRKRSGAMVRELRPAVHNLIFVHGTKTHIYRIKQEITWLQWLTRPDNGKNVPVNVPDRDMEQFIAVTNTYNEHLIYIRPEEIDLRKGTPVRIIGGQFDGFEGVFIKVKGARKKRVVVMLKGILGVAMAEVTPDLLEIL